MRDFSHPSRSVLVPSQRPIQGYRISFPGVKRPGRGANYLPASSAEIKERVALYLFPPSGPSWSLLRRTLLLSLTTWYLNCSAHERMYGSRCHVTRWLSPKCALGRDVRYDGKYRPWCGNQMLHIYADCVLTACAIYVWECNFVLTSCTQTEVWECAFSFLQ